MATSFPRRGPGRGPAPWVEWGQVPQGELSVQAEKLRMWSGALACARVHRLGIIGPRSNGGKNLPIIEREKLLSL